MPSPLRIALIRQNYRPDGGAERFVSRAMSALVARGAEITLFARKWVSQPGIHFERCAPPALGRLTRDWGFARAVCGRLRRQRFDLVQSHERLTCCDIYRAGDGVHRAWLERRGGGGMRWQDRLTPYHRYVMATEKALFESPRLRAVICNSHMVREEILARFAIAPEKLQVIYSGVDLALFHPHQREHRQERLHALGIPVEAPVFLFVGSGFARKGLAITLEAMARLSAPAHLVVLGQDKDAARYAHLAEHLGLGKRAHFAGAVPDPAAWYGLGHALVLPTVYDPFPNVVLEAMACGLPVLTSHACGGAELIMEGRNGYVRDDVEGLAEAMGRLCEGEFALRLGHNARATVEPCSLEAMSGQLIDLYTRLVS